MHPGAGCELEILSQPAIEHQALGDVPCIGEAHRIAGTIKALLVERSGGQVRPLPIAGRDIGAAHPHFELAAAGHELHFDAGRRNADHAGAVGEEMTRRRKRRSLSGAPG